MKRKIYFTPSEVYTDKSQKLLNMSSSKVIIKKKNHFNRAGMNILGFVGISDRCQKCYEPILGCFTIICTDSISM